MILKCLQRAFSTSVERFWLSFLENKPLEKFIHEYNEDNASFFEGIHRQSHDFEVFVNSLSDAVLESEFTIEMPWLKGKQPCYVYIQHVVNHSTYHRGQLITMGRGLGLLNPPNTDFTMFLMKYLKTN